MYEYAFVGYLDHETEVNFRRLWKDLSEQNISHYGVETKGKRPHITIADYDALDKNRFIQLADRFYEDKMVQAFSYCKKNIDKIHGTLSEIALVELKLNNDGVAIEDTVIFSKELKATF